MAKDEETIKKEILAHIDDKGGPYSGWYVGIAEDPEDRLFNDHSVQRKGDYWIYRKAESHTAARNVEDYFVNDVGTKGGTGGGDENTKSVYAYKTNSHTKE